MIVVTGDAIARPETIGDVRKLRVAPHGQCEADDRAFYRFNHVRKSKATCLGAGVAEILEKQFQTYIMKSHGLGARAGSVEQ